LSCQPLFTHWLPLPSGPSLPAEQH
jgi:hypothetical protein